MVRVSKEQLMNMSGPEIATFAWQYLGVSLDPTMDQIKLITKLLGMATRFS